MSGKTKTCPKCGREARDDHHANEHSILHGAAHMLHHHPVAALIGFTYVGVSKLFGRTYTCSHCRHSF